MLYGWVDNAKADAEWWKVLQEEVTFRDDRLVWSKVKEIWRTAKSMVESGKEKELTKDEEVVVIESVKAASDILAPLAGKVLEVNDAIVEDPSLVNSDPIGEGWFFKMEIKDSTDFDAMMTEEEYKKFIS